MHKDEKKKQTDLKPKVVNRDENQKAGYGGRDLPKDQNKEEE